MANNWSQLKFYNKGKCGGKFEKIYKCEEKICSCKYGKKHNSSLAGDHRHDGGNPCPCSVGGVAF